MKLFFLAHGSDEESPRNVLIRTALANGFGSVTAMARAMGSKESRQPFAWQMRHSKLVTELSKNTALNGGQFRRSFYTQRGPTSESPVEVMGLLVPAASIRAEAYCFCPECLRNVGHRAIQDLIWLDTCPYHECRYEFACPNCQKPIQWTQLVGNHCRCGFDLCISPTAASQSHASHLVLDFFRRGDQDALDRFMFALRALRYEAHPQRLMILEMAARVANCDEQTFNEVLALASKKYPCLPVRALMAPWMTATDVWIRNQISRLLISEVPKNEHIGSCRCSELQLYQDEMLKALNVSTKNLKSLLSRNLVQRKKQQGVRWIYSAINLCKLLESQQHAPNTVSSVSEALHSDDHNDLITIEEAAVRLGVYPEAARNALSNGFIQPHLKKGPRGKILINAASVAQFSTDFIFIGQLADELALPRTTLSAKLLHLGVQPVSGPLIDGGLVTIYRRTDLGQELLLTLQGLVRYKSMSGRKRASASCGAPEPDDSCVSAVAARMLQVSLHDLKHLHDLGHLTRVQGAKRRFTMSSVLNTKALLERMLTLKSCARELSMSPQTFSRRFVQSGFVEHLRLGAKVFIPQNRLTQLKEHRLSFVSLCEADEMLDGPIGYSTNLVRMGKINPISPGEPGYVPTVRLLHRNEVNRLKS